MYSENNVVNKLNELLEYSCSKDSANASIYRSLMNPLLSVVNSYFHADRSDIKVRLNDLELALYNDIMKRNTEYTLMQLPMNTDFPECYSDLRKLFYTFPCMNTTNEQFYSAWIIETDSTGTGLSTVTGNSLIDEWKTDISGAIAKDADNINSFYDWLITSATDAGMVLLWEDVGQTVSHPTIKEIANSIFIEKHFSECIEVLNLPAYKPTYI